MTSAPTQERRLTDIRLILKDLLKVIKVVSMYPETNPLPQSLKRSFSEKLVSIAESHGELQFVVTKTQVLYQDQPVFTDTSREDSLAGLFFESGVTGFAFKEGIEVGEIYALLEVIKTYLNDRNKNADLVSSLWEVDLAHFGFTTVEDVKLAEYDGDFRVQELFRGGPGEAAEGYAAIFTGGAAGSGGTGSKIDTGGGQSGDVIEDAFEGELPEGYEWVEDDDGTPADYANLGMGVDEPVVPGKKRLARRKRPTGPLVYGAVNQAKQEGMNILDLDEVDSATCRIAEAAKAMGLSDLKPSGRKLPNTSLILNDEFKLSEEDEKEIAKILEVDASFDPYESTIELLKEMLLQEGELSAFFETVSICEKIMQEWNQMGRLTESGRILRYLADLEARLEKDKQLWADRLKDARITAGSRERLRGLTETLNKNPQIGTADLRRYLDNFGWESLSGITDLLGDLEHRTHRECLCDYLVTRGRDNIAVISKGIYDKRWYVVRNSVAILARIDDEKALSYLQRAVNHEDRRVRLELMKALRVSQSARALEILRKACLDPDKEIRHEAINSLVARRGAEAFSTLTDVVTHERFPTWEPAEQQTLLNLYSSLGGEHAIEYLQTLATRFNLWRDQSIAFYRQAAFKALTHNTSEQAEQVLLKLASGWRPEIRRMAKTAIEQRRELMLRQTKKAGTAGGADAVAEPVESPQPAEVANAH